MSNAAENSPYFYLVKRDGTNDYLLFVVVPVQNGVTCHFPGLQGASGGKYLLNITQTGTGGGGLDYSVHRYEITDNNASNKVKLVVKDLAGVQRYSNIELIDAELATKSTQEWDDLKKKNTLPNLPYLYLKNDGWDMEGMKKMYARVLVFLEGYEEDSKDTTLDPGKQHTANLILKENSSVSSWYVPPVIDMFHFLAQPDPLVDIATFEITVAALNNVVPPVKTKKGKTKAKSKNHVDNPYYNAFWELQKLITVEGLIDRKKLDILKTEKQGDLLRVQFQLDTSQNFQELEDQMILALKDFNIVAASLLEDKR